MYRRLGDPREREVDRAVGASKAGPELAKDPFSEESWMDHFVVGDKNVKEKANTNADDDEDDEDEMDSEDVLKANLIRPGLPQSISKPDLTSLLAGQVQQWLRAAQHDIRGPLGSNNWVVNGARTATGTPP